MSHGPGGLHAGRLATSRAGSLPSCRDSAPLCDAAAAGATVARPPLRPRIHWQPCRRGRHTFASAYSRHNFKWSARARRAPLAIRSAAGRAVPRVTATTVLLGRPRWVSATPDRSRSVTVLGSPVEAGGAVRGGVPPPPCTSQVLARGAGARHCAPSWPRRPAGPGRPAAGTRSGQAGTRHRPAGNLCRSA